MQQRRGREFWQGLIAEFEGEGEREEHAEFAARHGVLVDTFRTWLYRLRAERPRRARGVRVLPVTVVGGDGARREISIDCNGVALRFAEDTDPGYVAALVTALRSC